MAGEVIGVLRQFGFYPLARDCETSWQYNQMFVSEKVMTGQLLERVGTYVDNILRRPMPEAEGRSVKKNPVPANEGISQQALPASPAAQYPDRSEYTSWLVAQGLIDETEAEQFLRTFNLPRGFENRAISRYGAAKPLSAVSGVTSSPVIAAPRAEPGDLPTLTFDGPYPPLLGSRTGRYLPVELFEAKVGRIFVGLRQTTLMLDEQSYFAGISRPASNWITPVFAKAPGELRLKGTVAILFANGATHFSHWMFDLLPKLEVLRLAGWPPEKIDHFVVNGFNTPFQKETFRRLGIPEDRVVPASGIVVTADTFLVPSDIRFNFRSPPWVCEFIRGLFLDDRQRCAADRMESRLYISRGEARRRRVLNEDQLREIVESRGFQTVFAEKLTIAEMAQLACRSSHIVTPHGAGATNVVFGPPGIRLLEAYSAHIAPEGWLLANAVGGRHYLLAGCDAEGRFPWNPEAYRGLSERARNYADYSIRPQDISRALDIMLG